MVMIAHQAIRVDFKLEAPTRFVEGGQECLITVENSSPVTAVIHEVITGVFEFYSQWEGHAVRINILFYIINS